MQVVTITPIGKKTHTDTLTYYSKDPVEVGSIVSAPLRSKDIFGIVTNVEDVKAQKADLKRIHFQLKKISGIISTKSLPDFFIQGSQETASHHAVKNGTVLNALLPRQLFESQAILENLYTENTTENTIRQEASILQGPLDDRVGFYKTYIRESFAKNQSVMLIVPAQNFIPFFKEDLNRGIDQQVFTFHSSMTQKQFEKTFTDIQNTTKPFLIIATPKFLWLPFSQISTIIVEQESNSAYTTVSNPPIDLRHAIEAIGFYRNTKVILADSILRSKTLYRYKQNELAEIHPPQYRLDIKPVKIVDKNLKEDETFSVIPEQTLAYILKTLKQKKHVIVFNLRKGLATQTLCHDCGTLVTENGVPIILHENRLTKKRYFKHPHTGEELSATRSCENCGGWDLRTFGIGTQTIYNFFKENYPDIPVFILDKEHTPTQKSIQQTYTMFTQSSGGVLIGTELLLHHVQEPVDAVVVQSFDNLLSLPAYTIYERIINLILTLDSLSLAPLVIQTYQPDHPLLKSVKTSNLTNFFKEDFDLRRILQYPPFHHIIRVSQDIRPGRYDEQKQHLEKQFSGYEPNTKTRIRNGKKQICVSIKVPERAWPEHGYKTNKAKDRNLVHILQSQPTYDALVEIDPELLV